MGLYTDEPKMSFKEKLKSGKFVLGTWINAIKDPVIIKLLSNVGLDYVLIDMEHSGIDMAAVSHMCILARECGIYPMVRPWNPDDLKMNGRLMDAGAMGIVVPHIENMDQARRIANSIRYFDGGTRGYCSRTAASGFEKVTDKSMRDFDDAVTCIVQFESLDAIKRADEILSVRGVDVAIVGRGDLAHEAGASDGVDGCRITSYVRQVYEAAEKNGKIKGLLINDSSTAGKWISEGIKLLTYGSEINCLIKGYKEGLLEIDSLITMFENKNGGYN